MRHMPRSRSSRRDKPSGKSPALPKTKVRVTNKSPPDDAPTVHKPPTENRTPVKRPTRTLDRVWFYGLHPVLAAIANPRRRCFRVLSVPAASAQVSDAVTRAAGSRPAIETVDRVILESWLPPEAVHQGVAAQVAPLPSPDLTEITEEMAETNAIRSLVVLDQVTDPRNVGAILRAAAAFGASAVVVQTRHAPEATGTLAKAAAGALEVVPMARVTNIARTLSKLKDAGWMCIGLEAHGVDALATLTEPRTSGWPPSGGIALVLGSEGSGLRRLVRESCDRLVRIPTSTNVNSLNVATAAAIALYEIRRTDNSIPSSLP